MASLLTKAVFKSAKLAIRFVVIPVMYTAMLGYVMQEAADRIRGEDAEEEEEVAFDPTLRPMP